MFGPTSVNRACETVIESNSKLYYTLLARGRRRISYINHECSKPRQRDVHLDRKRVGVFNVVEWSHDYYLFVIRFRSMTEFTGVKTRKNDMSGVIKTPTEKSRSKPPRYRSRSIRILNNVVRVSQNAISSLHVITVSHHTYVFMKLRHRLVQSDKINWYVRDVDGIPSKNISGTANWPK